jgi:hypothetical protein
MMSHRVRAREIFNRLLRDFRPKSTKPASPPGEFDDDEVNAFGCRLLRCVFTGIALIDLSDGNVMSCRLLRREIRDLSDFGWGAPLTFSPGFSD